MLEPLEKAIIEIVEQKQGVKAVNLPVFLAEQHPELLILLGNVPDAIEALVSSGELVEVEYSLPTMSYRAKSFLLPKGSQVIVNDGRMR